MIKTLIRARVHPETGGPSLTKQSFKDECDINKILEKYQRTGMLAHANQNEARYGFATSLDLRESLEIVREAQEMFDDLPVSIRKKFKNDPGQFLDFVQNPDNLQEMGELGMLNSPPEPVTVRLEALAPVPVALPYVATPNKP